MESGSRVDFTAVERWRFEASLAEFATSRGAEFLSRVAFPWPGQVQAVQAALVHVYRSALLPAGGAPDRREPLERAAIRAEIALTIGDPKMASDIVDWFRALPVEGGAGRHACAFYWYDVSFSTLSPNAPRPEGVNDALWHAFVAAIRRENHDGPEAYLAAHAGYIDETKPVEDLQIDLLDWQRGPFSDWDLLLAEAYGWDVADGNIWVDWQSFLNHRRITSLWRHFGPHFSAAEQEALVAWKRNGAAGLDAGADDPVMAAVLLDVADKTPPCAPRGILSSDA